MSPEAAAALERFHAGASWCAATALAWAAWAWRERAPGAPPRASRLHASAAAAVTTALSAAAGAALDAPYRNLLRQKLFVAAPWAGRLIERKLCWSVGAALFAACATALAIAIARGPARAPSEGSARSGAAARWLERAAFRAYVAAAALAAMACIASTIAAQHGRLGESVAAAALRTRGRAKPAPCAPTESAAGAALRWRDCSKAGTARGDRSPLPWLPLSGRETARRSAPCAATEGRLPWPRPSRSMKSSAGPKLRVSLRRMDP